MNFGPNGKLFVVLVRFCLLQRPDPDHITLVVDDVARVLSMWTGIPMGRMTEDELSRILKLSEVLSKVCLSVFPHVRRDALVRQT